MGEELVIIENEFIKLEKDELSKYFGYLDRKYECSLEIQKEYQNNIVNQIIV